VQLILQAALWWILYVALTFLPAAVAVVVDPLPGPRPLPVEASVAFAFIAFPLLLIQFALVARLRGASAPFGTDALMQFHRQIGIVALLFVLAHLALLAGRGLSWSAINPVSGPWSLRAGAVAFWALLLIVLSSLLRRRLRLRYEIWQAIHLLAAVLVSVGVTVHILAISRYSSAPAVRRVVVAYAVVFVSLLAWYRLLRPMVLWRHPWEVIANRDEGADVRTLCIRPHGHDGFRFDPGQFAWLITGRWPLWAQQHPISISSSAELGDEHSVEFTIKALGDWSSGTVPALVPGTRVWLDGPFGAFTPDRRPGQGFVLIAGGIGIAPMRSILLTMRDREDSRHVMLVVAANDADRLVCRAEIEAIGRTLHLDLVYVFEHPADTWSGERGRVTAELLRRHLPAHFARYQFFVCGPGPMLDALEGTLVELGVPPAAINTERFDMV